MKMGDKIHFIYKTTCIQTGKIYVGKHTCNKYVDENYLGCGSSQKKAIKDHGRENFTREILEFCDTPEQLCERELFWIKETNCTDPEIGYNIRVCSSLGMAGVKYNEDQLINLNTEKKINTKKDNFKGHVHTQLSKDRIRDSVNKVFEDPEVRAKCSLKGERNGFFKKKHSDESLAKMAESARNRAYLECPHCHFKGKSCMCKNHFDNCKHKTK
jgi:group I intron endonuclease